MRSAEFVVLGGGAMGSILAGHLARAGHSVLVIARGKRANQIAAEGIRIGGLIEFATRIEVLREPSTLRSAGVLIVAVKTPGTEDTLESLRHAEIGVALSIQNGVLKNEILARALGKQRVLGALANTSGELLASGDVRFTRNVNLFIGELTGELSERAKSLAGTLDESGVRATAVKDVLSREWSKFVVWLGMMSLSVITGAATWRFLADEHGARILLGAVREGALLARAQAIPLTDEGSPLLPLEKMIDTPDSEALEAIRWLSEDFRTRASEHQMSSLQDLQAGRPLEVEETLGYATRKARDLKIAVPVIETLYHLVSAVSRMRQ